MAHALTSLSCSLVRPLALHFSLRIRRRQRRLQINRSAACDNGDKCWQIVDHRPFRLPVQKIARRRRERQPLNVRSKLCRKASNRIECLNVFIILHFTLRANQGNWVILFYQDLRKVLAQLFEQREFFHRTHSKHELIIFEGM